MLRVATNIGERQNDNREAWRAGFFRRRGPRGLRRSGRADFERINADRLGDVFERHGAEIGGSEFEPSLDLAIGVLGKTDRAGLCDPFQSRRDIDAVAHQIAVALFNHVSQVDADAKLDPALRWQARIALDHAVLHLDGAAHRVDDATKLDENAIAGALDGASVMRGDGGIDQVAAEASQPRERAILVHSGEPAVADDIRNQDRRNFPRFRHDASSSRDAR